MKVKKLKKLLEDIPDDYDVVDYDTDMMLELVAVDEDNKEVQLSQEDY